MIFDSLLFFVLTTRVWRLWGPLHSAFILLVVHVLCVFSCGIWIPGRQLPDGIKLWWAIIHEGNFVGQFNICMWSALLFFYPPLAAYGRTFNLEYTPSPSFILSLSLCISPFFASLSLSLCLHDGVCDVDLFPLPCAASLFLSSLCVGWEGSRGTGVESSVCVCMRACVQN